MQCCDNDEYNRDDLDTSYFQLPSDTRTASLLLLLLLLKCQDYSAAITQLRGHFTKFISKTVVQLNADVC